MSHTAPSLLVAALVVLAGCAGGIAGPDATGAESTSGSGTVQFYVSDEENAIGQFEHLNVTVTSVGFQRADASGDAGATGNASADTTMGANATTAAENETGEWVERDVDSRTVDLTELQGANATLLGDLSVPSGEYGKVFVHVGGVNGTLQTGEQVNVKLPSQKLQLSRGFAVSSESSVNFVFDITVFEAGNSGKFVLKPVASESGTDVPIEVTEEAEGDAPELRASVVGNVSAGENESEPGDDGDGAQANASAELAVALDGSFAAGEEATVVVTDGSGEAVENATVAVDGTIVGQTDADGELTVDVPANVGLDSTVTVTANGASATVDAQTVAAAN